MEIEEYVELKWDGQTYSWRDTTGRAGFCSDPALTPDSTNQSNQNRDWQNEVCQSRAEAKACRPSSSLGGGFDITKTTLGSYGINQLSDWFTGHQLAF